MQEAKRSGWTIERGASFGVTLIILVLSPLRLSLAEPSSGSVIDVSGHFDVLAVDDHVVVRDNNFEVGQFTFNLASELNSRLDAAMQGAYEHGNFFGVARQDACHAGGSTVYRFDVPVEGTIFCTSFGGGYHVGPNAQLRIEYRLAEGSSNDTVFLQTAVAF